MAITENIDIEDLLVWAYRHQDIDRRAVEIAGFDGPASYGQAVAYWHALTVVGCMTWSGALRPASQMIEDPSEDAMRVHDAVLALPAAYLEWRSADEVVMPPWTAEQIAALGGKVSTVPSGHTVTWADGTTVPVDLLEPTVLVIVNARSGARPSAWSGWDSENHLGSGLPEATVMRDRALYAIWYQALVDLAAALEGRLDGYVVTGPRAESEPWQPRRVLEVPKPTIFRRAKAKAPRRKAAIDSGKK